ncbi:DUF3306 domain-containing protein [Antarctobacter jejuensis]|uniref:DUF3306 domain-containing protein n=1 Tax=Antarctobacter jejuensis TaxID=1439938 RepID=UPI003FCEFC71
MNGETPSDFWSRRRAKVAAETETELREAEAEAHAVEEERLQARPDEEILAELDLPVPEEMDSPDQVQSLLQAAVPQRLKTRALRRLWRLNPVLANVDGLVDYGEDFTDAATVVENLQTLYQVGKGMFDKVAYEAETAEGLAKAETDKAAAEDQDGDQAADHSADADMETTDAEVMVEDDDRPDPTPAPAPQNAPEPEIAEAPAASPRRMRFRFETAT